jgi:phage-related protein
MSDGKDTIKISLRPVIWMGDSRKNIREFPRDVCVSVGYALQLVQAGATPLES